jgi:hypothetical protein
MHALTPLAHTMHAQRADAYLAQSDGLKPLISKVKRLAELRRTVASLLPVNVSRSCSVANFQDGIIVIFAENSAIAAKLSLLAPALRAKLVQAGEEATAVVVEVQPPPARGVGRAKNAVLSAAAALTLAECSRQLPDSPLKAALDALANKARKRPGK